MSASESGIRGEFERAYAEHFHPSFLPFKKHQTVMLWAAKWMAERCAKELHGKTIQGSVICRQFAKDLEGGTS